MTKTSLRLRIADALCSALPPALFSVPLLGGWAESLWNAKVLRALAAPVPELAPECLSRWARAHARRSSRSAPFWVRPARLQAAAEAVSAAFENCALGTHAPDACRLHLLALCDAFGASAPEACEPRGSLCVFETLLVRFCFHGHVECGWVLADRGFPWALSGPRGCLRAGALASMVSEARKNEARAAQLLPVFLAAARQGAAEDTTIECGLPFWIFAGGGLREEPHPFHTWTNSSPRVAEVWERAKAQALAESEFAQLQALPSLASAPKDTFRL